MLEVSKDIRDSDIKITQIKEFETLNIEDVLNLFQDYKKRGVIVNSNFDDSTWRLYNGTSSFILKFYINELMFLKESKERGIGKLNDLINAIKTMVLYKLDEMVIQSIYGFVKSLISLLIETKFFNISSTKWLKDPPKENIKYFNLVLDFVNFYDCLNASEDYIELIDFHWENHINNSFRMSNQRNIGQFESAFKLSEVIEDFWLTAKQELKERYFPIKLWWEISTVIPIRTTELILTPYNCIKVEDNNYYLIIRRTSLKGKTGHKKVEHNVASDYRLQEIKINKDLYELIKEYKEYVDRYDTIPNFYKNSEIKPKQRDYLFSYRSYFKFIDNVMNKYRVEKGIREFGKEFFNSKMLHLLLDRFMIEIVNGKYNYELVAKLENDEELGTNQIEMVNPMDTRHYAFINMVLNDVEPLFLKKIGGHDAIESGIHYFSHIDKFIKCFTYSAAKRIVNAEGTIKKRSEIEFYNYVNNSKQLLSQENLNYREVNNGWCSSQQSFNELLDCRIVNNNCLICNYFIPKNSQVYLEKIKENEKRVTLEIESLKYLVLTIKRAKNFREDFMQKVNSIKGYANQNADIISRVIMEDIKSD